MKWFNKQFLLYGILSVVLWSTVVSCEKKDDGTSDVVELLSFGPAGVKHGDDIRIIGNNMDKVTAVEFVSATVEKAGFTSQSREVIVLTVPQAAESGQIRLKTAQGDITSKAIINFEVPVVIADVPLSAKPGDNITLKGEYMNWINEVWFERGVVVTEFISRSHTELVLQVPLQAQSGRVVFSAGGTEPLVIESEDSLHLALPAITEFAPNPAERGDELTITGTDLDLVEGILFKGLTAPLTEFVRKTETEIVVTIPEDANKGAITLVSYSNVHVESEAGLELLGGLPPLAPLAAVFYDDALQNGWQKWGGWGGGSADIDNDDNVRDGDKAIKVVFAGDWGGALQMGGGNAATTGSTHLVLSILGMPGTADKELNVIIAEGVQTIVTITEGEWTEYLIPLSDLGSPEVVSGFTLQDRGWSGTIYVDHIGLR